MVYVILADGFEEIEALTVVDILRRAEIETKTVSLNNELDVRGAHKIVVKADAYINECDLKNAEMLVLPGGMPGTINLEKNTALNEAISYRAKNDLWIAAICAAPSILGKKGYLRGEYATCYPGFEKFLDGASHSSDNVVVSGNFITSKGPGTAMDFALEIVSVLKDESLSLSLKKQMQYR